MAIFAFLLLLWCLCVAGVAIEEDQKRDYCQQYSYYSQIAHEPYSDGTVNVFVTIEAKCSDNSR